MLRQANDMVLQFLALTALGNSFEITWESHPACTDRQAFHGSDIILPLAIVVVNDLVEWLKTKDNTIPCFKYETVFQGLRGNTQHTYKLPLRLSIDMASLNVIEVTS